MSFKIDIEFDDAELQRSLNGLLSMGEDLTLMMNRIGSAVEASTKERIDLTNLAPDGNPWKPSRRALADGGRTLVKSGDLRDSIHHEASGNEVVIGPEDLPYAAIHQFGGVIKPKNAKKLAFKTPLGMAFLDQVTIPARPYLGISRDDEAEISSILEDFMREAVNGR